jgi:nicotinamidase-related amidase
VTGLSPLVVIDVQNGFVNPRSEHVVSPIAEFMRRWADAGGPVIATRFHNPPGSSWERLIHWKRLRESPEVDLKAEVEASLAAVSGIACDKTSYTSLTPEVEELLAGQSQVFLCGIATDGCVLKTAVDLFETGRTPYVIRDLCASHAGQEVHEAGLLLLSRFIGSDQIIGSDSALTAS